MSSLAGMFGFGPKPGPLSSTPPTHNSIPPKQRSESRVIGSYAEPKRGGRRTRSKLKKTKRKTRGKTRK